MAAIQTMIPLLWALLFTKVDCWGVLLYLPFFISLIPPPCYAHHLYTNIFFLFSALGDGQWNVFSLGNYTAHIRNELYSAYKKNIPPVDASCFYSFYKWNHDGINFTPLNVKIKTFEIVNRWIQWMCVTWLWDKDSSVKKVQSLTKQYSLYGRTMTPWWQKRW